MGPARLEVKDVQYDISGRRILDRISLAVRPGERVAVLGPNGSGKSTLMDLVYGLTSPGSGRIEIDGEPIPTLAVRELRTHVAMVRGIEIFEGTVLDNVVAGRRDVSHDDARAALEQVELWEDVKNLPNGVDTRLTSYGAGLSMGQARKLVLARAVAARPRLLLLDESLDDLDPTTRHRVARFLFAPERPWTIVLTTHDAYTLQQCTRSVVLEQGRVAS